MTIARAILDLVSFPTHAPGNLECRLAKTLFRDDGTIIDQGTRTGPTQTACHRFVVSPGDDIDEFVAAHTVETKDGINVFGYAPPDTALIHHIAAHEWRKDVLEARRARNDVVTPEAVFVVRALGFDLLGKGQLAVQIAKVTFNPGGDHTVTAKAHFLFYPDDPLDVFVAAINAFAHRVGYTPLAQADISLLFHAAAALFTPEAIEGRETAWKEWQIANEAHCRHQGIPALTMQSARIIDFSQRLNLWREFEPVPAASNIKHEGTIR